MHRRVALPAAATSKRKGERGSGPGEGSRERHATGHVGPVDPTCPNYFIRLVSLPVSPHVRDRSYRSSRSIELSPRRCDHRFLRESRSTSGPGTACSLRRRYLVGWTLGILGNPVARWRTFGRIYLAVMLSFILIFELFVSFTHYDVLYAMLGESRAVSTLS